MTRTYTGVKAPTANSAQHTRSRTQSQSVTLIQEELDESYEKGSNKVQQHNLRLFLGWLFFLVVCKDVKLNYLHRLHCWNLSYFPVTVTLTSLHLLNKL